jgi:hypothetical protein
MMTNEKRKKISPIPSNYKKYMNEDQQDQLRNIEGFGWKLFFIRRPSFCDPTIVVCNQEGDSVGVLEEDGRLNLDPNIIVRD